MTTPDPGALDDPGAPDDLVGRDTKDWTWVLHERCPQCGLAAGEVDPTTIAATVRALVGRWRTALARPDARVRPEPGRWSAVEYGAHVRDALRVFDERLRMLVEQDDPQFADWDQDAAALAGRYGRQDPAIVADELAAASVALAARLDAVRGAEWDRSGRRSNGSVFTVRTLGQYLVHDEVHHLHDVGA